MKKEIVFIVNPFSGVGKQKLIEKHLDAALDSQKFTPHIEYTKEPKHATEIAAQYVQQGIGAVIGVGGDGSINEIAKSLINTNVPLGIIPAGSGNGLARHFEIPMDSKKAMEVVNNFKVSKMDTFSVNKELVLSIFGVGFDAFICEIFATKKSRGLMGYLKLTVNNYLKYPEYDYQLVIDGQKIDTKAFFITVANSTQFGNNAKIAPKAIIDDGLLNVVIAKKAPVFAIPFYLIKLFGGTVDSSRFLKNYTSKEITILQPHNYSQIDGEYAVLGKELKISIQPKSLNIIC